MDDERSVDLLQACRPADLGVARGTRGTLNSLGSYPDDGILGGQTPDTSDSNLEAILQRRTHVWARNLLTACGSEGDEEGTVRILSQGCGGGETAGGIVFNVIGYF